MAQVGRAIHPHQWLLQKRNLQTRHGVQLLYAKGFITLTPYQAVALAQNKLITNADIGNI
ncbi:hypothetical protein A8M52_00910 [Escherichia coli]|nr:hypothetical protein A8M52_00910 [Escherichia coli]